MEHCGLDKLVSDVLELVRELNPNRIQGMLPKVVTKIIINREELYGTER